MMTSAFVVVMFTLCSNDGRGIIVEYIYIRDNCMDLMYVFKQTILFTQIIYKHNLPQSSFSYSLGYSSYKPLSNILNEHHWNIRVADVKTDIHP